jgi:cytochrome P450
MCALVAAGTLTTAVLLTTWTFLLCTHPEAYAELTKEVRERFAVGQLIDTGELMNLPYLSATINETLRLFPPAIVSLQRETPVGGATIDGRQVAGSATVSVSPWAASRSEHNFTKPNEFRPERWLDDGTGPFAKDDLNASKPFSLGSRVCIGQDMALLEAKLTIVHLLLNFDMELDKNRDEGRANAGWTLDAFPTSIKSTQIMLLPDLWVRLRKRAANGGR